ncbi:MAG: cytochrome-c oxidase, cbb3-type subunit III [Hyphomicrobiales bacterium]|nr:cytochrome-c oxidase, cbb3-type subunit III [Hyphomicrobiales bacterium]
MAQVDKDALTGTETTGHEWDGIKELNTPLPKWWLYTLYVTVIWAVGYCIAMPSVPWLSGYTKGVLGYSSRANHNAELADVKAQRASTWLTKFEAGSAAEIAKDSDLLQYAMAGGRVIFAENCAPCHGSGGQGAQSFPVLADDDWLWGGTLEAIETTIRHGIRSGDDDARVSDMPAYGRDELLQPAQIQAVADYVVSLGGGGGGSEAGKAVFDENCAACHGEKGMGMQDLGAPNLTDAIWLYGSGRDAIIRQVTAPKHGVMPAWAGRLDDVSIKQVTIYVHSLGGGK